MKSMTSELLREDEDSGHINTDVFRAIADYTYDSESWHAPDGQVLWMNAAIERLSGFSPNDCLAMTDYPLPLVADTDRDKISKVLSDAKAGGSGNDIEFQLIHRNGSKRWGAVSWQPIYDDAHRHLGFRASIRDVTERHHLREELRLHNQHLEQLVQERTAKIAQLEEQRLKMEKLVALGQMAAGIAHEVNNPLAGIRNAFALFKSNLTPDDQNYELLELIDGEIERISAITHQMYQLYRPSQQPPIQFDLCRVVNDVIVLAQPLASKSDIQLTITKRDCVTNKELKETEVVLREGELKQILLNVVRNAIQATPPKSVVQILISTTRSKAELAVIDQGDGVSEQVAARLFDPFFSTKIGTREGMGLGLSVSRSLTEAMGGTITIRNNKPENGACVTITIPRRIASDD